jgi:hypothetical protein
VGCEDQTVRIISLDPDSTLETISLQALTSPPSSICIVDMLDAGINRNQPTVFVNIGLQTGVLLRTVLDPVSGQLTDTRTRYLISLHRSEFVLIASCPQIPWYTAGSPHSRASQITASNSRAVFSDVAQLHTSKSHALYSAHIRPP